MTKIELLEALECVPDDAEIGAYWDDTAWPIHTVIQPDAVISTSQDTRKYAVLIDCS